MSLNWNLEDVDRKFTHAKADAEWPNPTPNFGGEPIDREAEYMRPETEILIYHTMAVSMGSITQKNYNEFYMRVLIWEALESCSKHSKGSAEYWNRRDGTNFKAGDSPITWERVRGHIGLCTNVPEEPRAKWIKRTCDRFVEAHDRIGREEAAE
jgi:hypothetical protein